LKLFIAIGALLAAAAIGLLVWPLLRAGRNREGAASRAGIAATVVASLLPAAAFVTYFWTSNWDWNPPERAEGFTAADLQRVIAELQGRLARKPDDVQGWKLLGRSATVLGDFALAREAFGEAYTRTKGEDAEAVVGYAESLVLLDEREIDGQAGELFERALVLAPDNPRGLWYGGIVAYRRGDMPLAQQRWVELQNQELAPELREVLAQRLAELDTSADAGAATSGEDVAASAIDVSVDIAPSLADKAPQDATLYVIARRGSGGPPLAVVRRNLAGWPVQVRVSDSDAMLPGMKLAGAGPLKLVARISQSGQPIAASGDLFGEVGYDFSSARPANIVIDRIVP
jgi:cytochrome c-type biogenesis protein CcmH